MNQKERENRSKMNDLSNSKLEMQNYLKFENINKAGVQTLFKYRVRMANFGENYRVLAQSAVLCGIPILTIRRWPSKVVRFFQKYISLI